MSKIVDVVVLEICEQIVEVAKVILQEHVQQRTVKQMADDHLHTDNQLRVQIQVFKGERAATKHSNLWSEFNLDGVPAASRGEPEMEATFGIDDNEILNAAVKNMSAGNPTQIPITNGRTLPADNDRTAQNAEKNQDEDEEHGSRVGNCKYAAAALKPTAVGPGRVRRKREKGRRKENEGSGRPEGSRRGSERDWERT